MVPPTPPSLVKLADWTWAPVKGSAISDGEVCAHLPIEVLLQDTHTGRRVRVGGLATDDKGEFNGAIVLPQAVSLGDYSVVARTTGDAHCGEGGS